MQVVDIVYPIIACPDPLREECIGGPAAEPASTLFHFHFPLNLGNWWGEGGRANLEGVVPPLLDSQLN